MEDLLTLEEVKKQCGHVPSGDPKLDYLDDLVNEKLVEIHNYKNTKNRLMMLECLPELFVLIEEREKVKRYTRKQRLKFKVLKILYKRRHDEAYMSVLRSQIQKKVEKEVKKQKRLSKQ